jgi:pimeloyl-ACP methyl ester carboxylesterase
LYRDFLLKELFPLAKGDFCSSQLQVPTLLLFGTQDQFISTALLDGYEPYVVQLNIEYFHDCGHFIAEEKPDLVATKIKEFFNR